MATFPAHSKDLNLFSWTLELNISCGSLRICSLRRSMKLLCAGADWREHYDSFKLLTCVPRSVEENEALIPESFIPSAVANPLKKNNNLYNHKSNVFPPSKKLSDKEITHFKLLVFWHGSTLFPLYYCNNNIMYYLKIDFVGKKVCSYSEI